MRIADDEEARDSGRGQPPEQPSRSDLTARARIRDAALELFAERGYSGTSIRDVAAAAEVSPGLVQHHFGSKAGLRSACDAHVVEALKSLAAGKLERQEYDRDAISSLLESSLPILRYIARGLTEDWPGMAAIFDQGARDSEDWLTSTWPERFPPGSQAARTHAGILAAMSLGTLVLHGHVARWMGADPLDRGQAHVRSMAMVEVVARLAEFMETSQGRSMRTALSEYGRETSSSGEVVVDE
jgi:TetR/AcrR family transcriptional regulator, regulator of cefoperazone and chloramphenicol sensitivity